MFHKNMLFLVTKRIKGFGVPYALVIDKNYNLALSCLDESVKEGDDLAINIIVKMAKNSFYEAQNVQIHDFDNAPKVTFDYQGEQY